jgi:hypothetical protein
MGGVLTGQEVYVQCTMHLVWSYDGYWSFKVGLFDNLIADTAHASIL